MIDQRTHILAEAFADFRNPYRQNSRINITLGHDSFLAYSL